MALKPPKQFCGEAHWSGESCKACDGLRKDRVQTAAQAKAPPGLIALGPCEQCVEHQATIDFLREKLEGMEVELKGFHDRLERERKAVAERVKLSRERKRQEAK